MFKNKKVGDIINEDTKILTNLVGCYDVHSEVLKSPLVKTHGNLAAICDFDTGLIICFKNDKPVALFYVYEIHNFSFNGERGHISVVGHETAHEYWFDNGEYATDSTR